MAVTDQESRRRRYSTDGSLALDFDWAVHRQELEHAGEIPRQSVEAPYETEFRRSRTGGYHADELARRAARPERRADPRRRRREVQWTEPAEDPYRSAREGRRRTTGRREKPRRKTRAAARNGFMPLLGALYQMWRRIPVLYLAGAVLAVFMAFQMLTGCIALTQLSSETVTLKETLQTLEEENKVLSTQYEELFDLTAVEAEAVSLGMVKPSRSQIIYGDYSAGDSAVVYRTVEKGFFGSVADSVLGGVNAVRDYFT